MADSSRGNGIKSTAVIGWNQSDCDRNSKEGRRASRPIFVIINPQSSDEGCYVWVGVYVCV